jgi:hypothetical protein
LVRDGNDPAQRLLSVFALQITLNDALFSPFAGC